MCDIRRRFAALSIGFLGRANLILFCFPHIRTRVRGGFRRLEAQVNEVLVHPQDKVPRVFVLVHVTQVVLREVVLDGSGSDGQVIVRNLREKQMVSYVAVSYVVMQTVNSITESSINCFESRVNKLPICCHQTTDAMTREKKIHLCRRCVVRTYQNLRILKYRGHGVASMSQSLTTIRKRYTGQDSRMQNSAKNRKSSRKRQDSRTQLRC